ncbi:MAG: hypothetical protein WAQ98_27740, partial [Blastocatellia bacterium]
MFHKLKNLTKPNIRGFSLVEYMISAILICIMFGGIGKIMLATINNGRFVQKFVDVNLLSLKKASELYNDSVNQANFIPKNQTQIGSINPNDPVTGYFDLLNESGCLLSSFAQNPNDDDGGKGGKGGSDDNPKGKTAKNDTIN